MGSDRLVFGTLSHGVPKPFETFQERIQVGRKTLKIGAVSFRVERLRFQFPELSHKDRMRGREFGLPQVCGTFHQGT
jgi:hypothetical protein